MILGVDPKVDYAFKHLFGREQNEALLIHLIEAVLQLRPGEHIVDLEILNPFNDKDALDDKLSILDIKARDQRGRLFNIEMQLVPEHAFGNRVLYYWSRLYGSQLHEGEDYAELRPTISICFVDAVLFPQTPEYHLAFQLRTADHAFVFTDDLALHILELPKFTRSPEQLAGPLDLWLYFLCHGAQLDPAGLPAPLKVPEIQRALEDLTVLTQEERERERYEARLKYQRDELSRRRYYERAAAEALEKGMEQGLTQGLTQGRAEGLTQGRAEGRAQALVRHIQFCQRLLNRALTPAEELLKLPLAELEQLADQMEKEVPQS